MTHSPAWGQIFSELTGPWECHQQNNFEGAHEISSVTRRLFKEQNLFPEPPDEKPLIKVEQRVKKELDQQKLSEINARSNSETVATLLEKYLYD